ncbi:MAG: sensor domain-containing diguanylate cyclase [Thermoanaerobaculia bacterium]
MSRTVGLRIWQSAVILTACALLLFAIGYQPTAQTGVAAFFAVFVLVAMLLKGDGDEAAAGFEAVPVFSTLLILHDVSLTIVTTMLGAVAYAVFRSASLRRWKLETFQVAAEAGLTYAIVSGLYSVAVAHDAQPAAKAAGYILLVVAYLAVHVAFVAVSRSIQGTLAAVDMVRLFGRLSRTLLIVSPVVAVVVLMYESHGYTGFAIGFLPVLLIAFAQRNAADAEQQNEQLLRRNRELTVLTESSIQILSAETDEDTLRRLVALLSRIAPLKACAIVTWETNPETPASVYRFGECLPSDQQILRWVESAGFAQSAPSRPFIFQNDMRRFPLSSHDAVQILIGVQTAEVVYGVLLYETEDKSVLKGNALDLVAMLTSQTALAVQDRLLQREMREKNVELERHNATMSTILDVSTSLIGQFDIDTALTQIAEAIRQSLGFRVVVFALYDKEGDVFLRRAQVGLDDVWEDMRTRPVSAVEIRKFMNDQFRISKSYFVPHTSLRQSENDFFVRRDNVELAVPRRADEWHENDMLLAPLRSGDEMLGFVSARDPEDGKVPTLDKVQTLEVFATQAVTTMQSARQYGEIRRLTFIDGLTPAYNHRFFQEALAKELHRSTRGRRSFSLAMLDIDDFKKINDTFGHPVGDEILKGIVEVLMTNARDTDIIARYGGEEFALILPEASAEAAAEAAYRFRELVEETLFNVPQANRTLRVTISVGVAAFPEDATTAAEIISRADSALYYAKKHGKNQVALSKDVVARQGELAM